MTTSPALTRSQLAAIIDHTLLAPEATPKDIHALCAEAKTLGVHAVCVSPTLTTVAALGVAGSFVRVVAVAGFPSGAHHARLKAEEAGEAAATGAHEVDMVINLALAAQGHWKEVEQEIAGVRGAAPGPTLLKVIIESALLDDEGIRAACRAAESAGADFVKTSTGFGPGGATVADVRLMREAVGPSIGVKASGGVRTLEDLQAMVAAGATRIGTSAGVRLVAAAR